MKPLNVLFLCTGNAARSQMAEGLLRHIGGDKVKVCSAGTEPKGLHPLSVQALQQAYQIDISQHNSDHVSLYQDQPFDYVITVCDNARDHCPVFTSTICNPQRLHWGLPDPAAVEGDEATQLAAFKEVAADLHQRISQWWGSLG